MPFFAGYYLKHNHYNPNSTKKEILVGPSNSKQGTSYLKELTERSNNQLVFKHIRDLYPRFTFEQLTEHPAVVLFPYAAMSYSIVEFYAINMPIFVLLNFMQ